MRIRSIKPEFYKHEGLYDLEAESRLPIRVAFSGLWGASDREGRFKWRPRALKSDILPYDPVDFSDVLNVLERGGFIVRYSDEDGVYGFIPSFFTHQRPNSREAKSVLPEPTKERISHACTCMHVQDQEEGEGKGKGKEGIISKDIVSFRKKDSKPSQVTEEGKTEQPELEIQTKGAVDRIIELYHEKCKTLPRVRKVTPGRRQAIIHRFREYKGNFDAFEDLFDSVACSDFLSGRNGRWQGCSLDWLMEGKHMIKVLEGHYDNRP